MAAGFVISRILMLCLLNGVTYGSGSQAVYTRYEALQDGGQNTGVRGFRRPLHYVRSLRQPKMNPEHLNPFRTRQSSQRTLKTDLNSGQSLEKTQTLVLPQKSQVQPLPQRSYPVVQPRGIAVSLDLPFYKPSPLKETGSAMRDYERKDRVLQTKPSLPFQSVFRISESQNPERDSKKDTTFRKNTHDVSTSNVRVNLTIPLVTSLKPLSILSGLFENKNPSSGFQSSYREPEKFSSVHSEHTSPTISQTGEPARKKPGLSWSNDPDAGPKQALLQPYESTYTQPTEDKLTSAWQLNNHKIQQGNNENPLTRQNAIPQRPDSTKLQFLPIVKYLEHIALTKPQTSATRNNEAQPYSVQQQNVSPLQNMGSPVHQYVGYSSSSAQPQNGYPTSSADVKDLPEDQRGEKELEAAVPSLKLGFSFPVRNFLSNITKSDGGYFTIKPQSVGSLLTHYIEATKPQSNLPQDESSWVLSGFDDSRQQRTNVPPERNWPILNIDLGLQQKEPTAVPVPTKPTDGKRNFLSWLPSLQVGQDETTRTQSISPKKPEIGKPKFPVLAISEYPVKNDKYQITQPKPQQSERVQSLYSSLRPSTNSYIQGQTRPLSPAASTYDSSSLKPPSVLQPNVETHLSSHLPPISHGLPPFSSPNFETVATEKLQTWQKPVSSFSHQYNSGRDASYDPSFGEEPVLHMMPSRYQSQMNFPERDHEHSRDGNGYIIKNVDTIGEGSVLGQTYQTGKNTAEGRFNVQPLCESTSPSHLGSSSDLHYPYLNAETKPCRQLPCTNGGSKCDEPEMQSSNFPRWIGYSPKAESTSVSIPFSTFERVFTQSSYKPDQNGFKLHQYPVGQRPPQLQRYR